MAAEAVSERVPVYVEAVAAVPVGAVGDAASAPSAETGFAAKDFAPVDAAAFASAALVDDAVALPASAQDDSAPLGVADVAFVAAADDAEAEPAFVADDSAAVDSAPCSRRPNRHDSARVANLARAAASARGAAPFAADVALVASVAAERAPSIDPLGSGVTAVDSLSKYYRTSYATCLGMILSCPELNPYRGARVISAISGPLPLSQIYYA